MREQNICECGKGFRRESKIQGKGGSLMEQVPEKLGQRGVWDAHGGPVFG